MKRHNRPWTREDIATMRDMLSRGHSLRDIMERLGRTRSSISNKIALMIRMGQMTAIEANADGRRMHATNPDRELGEAPPPYVHTPYQPQAIERARDRAYAMLAAGDDPSSVRVDIKQMTGIDLGELGGLRPAGEAAARVLSGLEARK